MARTFHPLLLFVALTVVLVGWISAADVQVARSGFLTQATIEVETDADETQIDSICSLRQAIDSANNDGDPNDECEDGVGADKIMLPAGEYPIQFLGEFVITDDLLIEGAGAGSTVIDGLFQHRAFAINPGVELHLTDLTIRNGDAAGECGGAIYNSGGTVVLTDVVVSHSTADSGGGICTVMGSVALNESTLIDNEATDGSGGGLQSINEATITIADSNIRSNDASVIGGGVNVGEGTLDVDRSLFSANSATSGGSAINSATGLSQTVATITNSTFSGNSGEAIRNQNAGVLNLLNVTFTGHEFTSVATIGSAQSSARNTLFDDPCSPLTGTSLGNNINSSGAACGMANGPDDLVVSDAMLGSLQDNGGPTLTHALLEGSPAIDAGDDGGCPDEDQRGFVRPQGNACDIGAFESQFTAATLSPTPTVTPSITASPSASATEPPPLNPTQGDVDCDGDVDFDDFGFLLEYAATLSAGVTAGPCLNLGDAEVNSGFPWGDVNCDGMVDALDALFVLAHTVEIELEQAAGNCFPIGSVMT